MQYLNEEPCKWMCQIKLINNGNSNNNNNNNKIFFRRNLPIQKYLSDGKFRNCLPTERVFTEQVVRISLCLKLYGY